MMQGCGAGVGLLSGVSQGWVLAKLGKLLANMRGMKGWSRKSTVRNCRRRGQRRDPGRLRRNSSKRTRKASCNTGNTLGTLAGNASKRAHENALGNR